ncbi:hypothetical protein BH11CYA1_BH11CYA1_27370 [soil metagenome]
MASPLENDPKSADRAKDASSPVSDNGADRPDGKPVKPETKAVQEMTTADWQAANKPGPDAKVGDQPTTLPKVSLDASAAKDAPTPKDVLINPSASPEEKLKAVEALGRSGQTSVEIVDKDGSKRNLTIELEKAGARTLVHLYANDDQGKEHVVLRGVKNADGSWQQQQTEKGDAVGSYGTWWAKNMGDRTFFNDAVKPENKVADVKVAPEDLFSEKRNIVVDVTVKPLEIPTAQPDVKVALQPPVLEPIFQVYTPPAQIENQSIPRIVPEQREAALQDLPLQPREVVDPRDTVVPWNRPDQRVVSDAERLNQLFDGVAKSAGYARRMTQVDGGSVYFRAGMAIDADGSPRARQIDPDGQTQTSLRHRNGASVNAETTKYFVLPLEKYQQFGVRKGDIAAVRYGDNVRFAVFADVGPHQKLGEGSMALAASLGINSNPRRGGTQRPEVEYIVFPGSGNGRPLHANAHEDLGRHYLGKAYRNTKN